MERSKTLVKNMEINQRNFRKEHLAIRNAMLPGEVAEKSSTIVKRLLQSEWYKDTKEIFAYYPLGNEVDCHALFLQAWADGKRIALPRTKEENQMDFFYIDSLKQLEEGTFHVMEPVRGSEKADPLQQPVIVPGSVFGRDGSRYGYGKGYYDRFLPRCTHAGKIGIAFEAQRVARAAVDGHDQRLDAYVTERGIYQWK